MVKHVSAWKRQWDRARATHCLGKGIKRTTYIVGGVQVGRDEVLQRHVCSQYPAVNVHNSPAKEVLRVVFPISVSLKDNKKDLQGNLFNKAHKCLDQCQVSSDQVVGRKAVRGVRAVKATAEVAGRSSRPFLVEPLSQSMANVSTVCPRKRCRLPKVGLNVFALGRSELWGNVGSEKIFDVHAKIAPEILIVAPTENACLAIVFIFARHLLFVHVHDVVGLLLRGRHEVGGVLLLRGRVDVVDCTIVIFFTFGIDVADCAIVFIFTFASRIVILPARLAARYGILFWGFVFDLSCDRRLSMVLVGYGGCKLRVDGRAIVVEKGWLAVGIGGIPGGSGSLCGVWGLIARWRIGSRSC